MESGPTGRLVVDRPAPIDVNTPKDLADLAAPLGYSFPARPTA